MKKTVLFNLTSNDLIFFDAEGNEVLEEGKFTVFTGTNSANTTPASFRLVK